MLVRRMVSSPEWKNPVKCYNGVFGRGLEIELVIVDWNFLVVDHLRKLSRDVVLVSVLGNFLGGFWVDELAFKAMRYGDQRWDKRRLFAEHENLVSFIRIRDEETGVEMIGVVQGQQCMRERDVFRFIEFGIHESEVFEKTSCNIP
ncbi:hypothetical protein Tco_0586415 [Tanacetum coccineum]